MKFYLKECHGRYLIEKITKVLEDDFPKTFVIINT